MYTGCPVTNGTIGYGVILRENINRKYRIFFHMTLFDDLLIFSYGFVLEKKYLIKNWSDERT